MADDKQGRDKQAHDARNRQRTRDVAEELERMEETEPPVDDEELEDLAAVLEPISFPATGAEVVASVGERQVASPAGTFTVDELLPDTDAVTYDSLGAVEARVRRPTVAAAMKEILEATASLPDETLAGSQWEAYERTLRELAAIDADDEDEGVEEITDWILERLQEKGKLPGSRDVRRQAAKFCRANGYRIRNDEWLGV